VKALEILNGKWGQSRFLYLGKWGKWGKMGSESIFISGLANYSGHFCRNKKIDSDPI
jgi:hypothetical protein